ncbi:MAG: D-alanyl-D-alanine carboxypeptidase [Clostridiales bacterium]|nr:D-alanyl-D-alanine carboxypeptidase [Clostridiales bacterium]
MRWKRALSLALCIVLLVSVCRTSASAVSTSATSTYVIDVDSGRVLYEDNADEQRPIASITKIMTALVAIEASTQEDLAQVCTVSAYAASVGGSSLYLVEGNEITLLSALYGCLLRSGNDCAVVVAEAIAGSEEAFTDLMNEKAAELGMTSSHFVSCNGLVDEDNYSTAHDMALLGAYAIQNELFAEICGTWFITTEDGYAIENHNKLLSYDDRCIGIKTGFTTLAGRTLVSCAQDPDTGARVVCVTLNDSYDFNDHMAVYDWAFATYTPKTLCTAGETLTTLTFAGNGATATLVTAEDLTWPLSEGEESGLSCKIICPSNVPSVIQAGDEAGSVTYYLDGEEIASATLYYGEVVY